MEIIKIGEKEFRVDSDGFLIDFKQWDRDFAEAMASRVDIDKGLTQDHWKIIDYIHDRLKQDGRCPTVYETCRVNGLSIEKLGELFPAGYLRGACRLAGVTYKEGYVGHSWLQQRTEEIEPKEMDKIYREDVRGFLIDPEEWDHQYAVYKAYEMKMSSDLTERHWEVINFLRRTYKKERHIATVIRTCEAVGISIEELERLFPDGYHRGAVKIAGLKAR